VSKNKIINVLIPDGESILTVYILRCLSIVKNVKSFVISSEKYVESKFSRHKVNFYHLEGNIGKEQWIEKIKQYVHENEIDVILPVFIHKIRIFSEFKYEFENITNLLVPELKYFEITDNKWMFFEFLKNKGVELPRTYELTNPLLPKNKKLKFPLILKPKSDLGGRGIKILKNVLELEKTKQAKDMIIQEYISGFDIDMSVLCKSGKILAYTIQKNADNAKQSDFHPPLFIEFLKHDEVFNCVKNMMRKLKWEGVAHIDLRYDVSEKKVKVIELNPRYWGSIEGSNKVGVNFPYLHCLTAIGLTFKVPDYQEVNYIKNRFLFKLLKSLTTTNGIKISSLKYFQIKEDILDPLPKLYKYSIKFIIKLMPSKKEQIRKKFQYEVL